MAGVGSISTELLPTPTKSHYTFNLRDMSKVFQGVLQSSPKTVTNSNECLRLWSHECLRVFSDRMIETKVRVRARVRVRVS